MPNISTRLPSVSGTGDSSSSRGEHVTDSDMSAAGSRRTRNAVRVPGRALIWVIWPSTQMLPRRSIHCATFIATDRTALTGGISFVDSARHRSYVDARSYRRHLAEVRERVGWRGLEPGMFDAVRGAASERQGTR